MMDISTYFLIWNKLHANEQQALSASARELHYHKGDLIHTGGDCMGLILVTSGRLRAYAISNDGRKITMYRLFERDICRGIMEKSAPPANYPNEVMASRFSDVMWLIEQIMWKCFDKRLTGFLSSEANIEESNILKLTRGDRKSFGKSSRGRHTDAHILRK